jgi:phosphopantothenoylcysteine decarboxylase
VPVLALIICGAPLAGRAGDMVRAFAGDGWVVRLVATPAAVPWIEDDVVPQVDFRLPRQPKTYADPDALVVCPATFNTLNKIATGLADNYATALACEVVGSNRPVLIAPMVSDPLRNHPAFRSSVATLQSAGVEFLDVRTGGFGLAAGDQVVGAFRPEWLVTALRSMT